MTQGLIELQAKTLAKFARYSLFAAIFALMLAGLFQYKGQLYIYLLFSIVSNALLYAGFRKNAIFFDAFIGVFLWLGFWLKLSVRVIFFEGLFYETVGNFDGSGAAFDHALLVSSCGLLGFLVASLVREKFIFTYSRLSKEYKHDGILILYKNYRPFILTGFVILVITIALTNIYFGFYQRGEITQTTLPFGLNGIYKWLLLFGLASISAVLLKCEFQLQKKVSLWLVVLSMLESFLTNVSMLSRGMILNVSALVYGIYASIKVDSLKVNFRVMAVSIFIFAILFASSLVLVNYIRATGFQDVKRDGVILEVANGNYLPKSMFLDRWVGMEGVMAVSSSEKAGWNLWEEAWNEKYSESTISFYDNNLITSQYKNTDFTKHHHLSLPGVVAFFFYPGSFAFLFASMFLLGVFAALIEVLTFKLGGNNLILCSLMAEIVAYRFLSFGYVPAQSYLLFGTILLNLFIIYFSIKFVGNWNSSKSQKISVLQ